MAWDPSKVRRDPELRSRRSAWVPRWNEAREMCGVMRHRGFGPRPKVSGLMPAGSGRGSVDQGCGHWYAMTSTVWDVSSPRYVGVGARQ